MSELRKAIEKYRDLALRDWKGHECEAYLQTMFEMMLNDVAWNSCTPKQNEAKEE